MRPAAWVLTALLLSGAALVGVELGRGALDAPAPKIADPCHPREGPTGGVDATIQRIVLDGLDGAACRLHTTREELVLSLGGGVGVTRRWDAHTIEVALRAGLLRSVDAAVQRGDVPEFLAPALRGIVERAPIGQLVRGGISLKDLLGG
ncbi:MAG TPA: hypothetical protein VHU60_00210 [Gaiellaceae bacterium]|jgi:hypothetical protein|nr:hypothetical protein [Gaiellaceae bacterium]